MCGVLEGKETNPGALQLTRASGVRRAGRDHPMDRYGSAQVTSKNRACWGHFPPNFGTLKFLYEMSGF